MKPSSFQAPWDTSVKVLTMMVSGVLGYHFLTLLRDPLVLSGADLLIPLGLPVALLAVGLACMVTGYSVDADGVVLHRLFWSRRLRRAEIASLAMPSRVAGRPFGLCGVWGFCGTSGFAYSRTLGLHIVAASAYDGRLIIARHRGLPVVISPSDSEAFIRAYHAAVPQS